MMTQIHSLGGTSLETLYADDSSSYDIIKAYSGN